MCPSHLESSNVVKPVTHHWHCQVCSQLRTEPGHTEPELRQPSCANPGKTLPLRVVFNEEPFPQHPPWAASFWGIHIFTRWLLRWAVLPSRCLLSCSSAVQFLRVLTSLITINVCKLPGPWTINCPYFFLCQTVEFSSFCSSTCYSPSL